MVADVVERTIETAIKLARQARKQCSRQERLRLKRARDRVLHFLACEGGATGVVTWVSHLSELAAELAWNAKRYIAPWSDWKPKGCFNLQSVVSDMSLARPSCS
jgi:hypothetical protein